MIIENIIRSCENITPTESILAQYVIEYKSEIEKLSIQQFAEKNFVSKSAVHRFCKKLGFNGFNELKVKVAQDIAKETNCDKKIDVNFPFVAVDDFENISLKLLKLYELSLRDTYNLIDNNELNKCIKLMHNAEIIDIYTQAHNINVAENFQDKMMAIGRIVNCPKSLYEQRCTAIASNEKNHVAVILSYSGKAIFLPAIAEILKKKNVKIIWIGRYGSNSIQTLADYYLYISDKENLRKRISQFSSHIAMQYIVDIIFSCIFKMDYNKNIRYIEMVNEFIDDRNIDEK